MPRRGVCPYRNRFERFLGEKVVTRELNLNDIQGNVTRSYGSYGFPCARYFFLHIQSPDSGREFVGKLFNKITTAAPWGEEKPKVTLNVAFTSMLVMSFVLLAAVLVTRRRPAARRAPTFREWRRAQRSCSEY